MAYEYLVGDFEFSQRSLDHLGAKGWRFVGYVGSKYVFERRKPLFSSFPKWFQIGAIIGGIIVFGIESTALLYHFVR